MPLGRAASDPDGLTMRSEVLPFDVCSQTNGAGKDVGRYIQLIIQSKAAKKKG
jgi:hypothetical protein